MEMDRGNGSGAAVVLSSSKPVVSKLACVSMPEKKHEYHIPPMSRGGAQCRLHMEV
jgi:hypothetical protein